MRNTAKIDCLLQFEENEITNTKMNKRKGFELFLKIVEIASLLATFIGWFI